MSETGLRKIVKLSGEGELAFGDIFRILSKIFQHPPIHSSLSLKASSLPRVLSIQSLLCTAAQPIHLGDSRSSISENPVSVSERPLIQTSFSSYSHMPDEPSKHPLALLQSMAATANRKTLSPLMAHPHLPFSKCPSLAFACLGEHTIPMSPSTLHKPSRSPMYVPLSAIKFISIMLLSASL